MNQTSLKIKEWREDPVQFVRDNFGVEPDVWQTEVLRVFPSQDKNNMRQAMRACAGPGKSAVLAWCGWNFLSCYGSVGEHPKGAAVSMTNDNLADNLWAEFAKWQGRSPYLTEAFIWTKSRITAKDHPETWFLSARSWPKTADPEEQGRVLSGLHSKYVLYLIDEAGDIPVSVLRSAEQGLSNCDFGKIMAAGNSTSRDGILYHASVLQRDNWYVTRITGDPDDPKRSSRVDIEWAKDAITKYGRDNPWTMAFVLGEFPPSSLNTLLGHDEVEAAMNRALKITDYDYSQIRIGVDVARFGSDATVLFPRQGLAAFTPIVMRAARTNEIAAKLARAKIEFDSEVEFVDDTGGYGAGVVDAYLTAGQSVIPINFAGKADDPQYFNKRSEIWFEMANWIKRGGALPNVPELVRELTTPTYTFQNGKFRLEAKDQIKKRLGYSTDHGDALALTFSIPDAPKATDITSLLSGHGKMKSEFDPFAEGADA